MTRLQEIREWGFYRSNKTNEKEMEVIRELIGMVEGLTQAIQIYEALNKLYNEIERRHYATTWNDRDKVLEAELLIRLQELGLDVDPVRASSKG